MFAVKVLDSVPGNQDDLKQEIDILRQCKSRAWRCDTAACAALLFVFVARWRRACKFFMRLAAYIVSYYGSYKRDEQLWILMDFCRFVCANPTVRCCVFPSALPSCAHAFIWFARFSPLAVWAHCAT